MLYLNKEDYFEVYLGSMVSNIGRDTLITLYQPIIGHDAVALYLTLYSEFKKQRNGYVSSHEDLMEEMNISINALQEARTNLEGIGLVNTYFTSKDGQNFYKYELLAPKTPAQFFEDLLFRGLLVRAIGEKKTNQLSNLYKSRKIDVDGYEDITTSFTDAFHPDLDSPDFKKDFNTDGTFTFKVKDVSQGFDRGAFLKSMETKYCFKPKFFKKKMLDEISRIALLYGVDEDAMSDYVSQSYIESENTFDFENVQKLAYNDMYFMPTSSKRGGKEFYNGSSRIAQHLDFLSKCSTVEYLSYKQHNTAPTPSDIAIINQISHDYLLPPSVINVIIDYTLEKCDNVLSRNFALKVAASIKRNLIETAEDAMNYLNKKRNKVAQSNIRAVNTEENTISDEDLASLLDDLGD